MIQVNKPSIPNFDEYIEEIKSIWDTAWLTNAGSKHKQLEKELVDFLGVERLALFCNGHTALEVCIQAMDLKGEVITTPFTFASTTHAIVRNNLNPVFCDINIDDYTLDVDKIEALINEKTSAILPVHVYGNVCNVEKIRQIACKYGLKVIYDAAHAFGITLNGKGIASFGDASMFSFHATKVFNTIEGGAVSINNSNLIKKINMIKNFGLSDKENVDFIGMNGKMNEFEAAMGICNLRNLKNQIEKRKNLVHEYRKRLSDIQGIKLCMEKQGVESNYAYFPVVFDSRIFPKSRDVILDELEKQQIIARKYFYPLTSNFRCYQNLVPKGDTEVAEWVSNNVLVLPLYADLSIENVERICNIILS